MYKVELRTHFFTRAGRVQAINGVSFRIMLGETLGMVGESGSGKTITCLSILKWLPRGARIVSEIAEEPLLAHGYNRRDRQARVREALQAVGLPHNSGAKFPHECSGGQRQRIGIARALTLEPALVALDEPGSALDVSIRSQVLNLLKDIQQERGIAYLLISHDMASVEYLCHRVGVMYLGKLVEMESAQAVCSRPRHPYTGTLIAAATPPGR
jgi:ABC-type glutathione transport system ATPase component